MTLDLDSLPEETKKFLRELDHEDIEDLKESIHFYRDVKVVGGFAKWMVITGIATFLAVVSLGDAIAKALGWLKASAK